MKIHLIANAHLDPVWLWHWQRGADEALATCRVACDLLDEYSSLVFTRGEAWVYEQVRRLDPELLERIRDHIHCNRWEVVNGWWVQPDCNLPSLSALKRNAELGSAWFEKHLGLSDFPVAYNVDTFGHGPYLPKLLQELGQQYYVMMRPGKRERSLPGHLFRWQSPDGAEVLTYRIPGEYIAFTPDKLKAKIDLIQEHPQTQDDLMLFYGVGNHGGGPTRALINWIEEHRQYAPDIELAFSSPLRYFQAVNKDDLPLVKGELQQHAIGCYSVCGSFKRQMRRAENQAFQAKTLCSTAEDHQTLDRAWETICFNQFHDILPGTAIQSAMDAADRQVGHAQSLLDELTYYQLRTTYSLPRSRDGSRHRIHLVNSLDRPFSGLAELDVWTDWQQWEHHLVDQHRLVPHQLVRADSIFLDAPATANPKILFHAQLEPGEHRVLQIRPGTPEPRQGAQWDGQKLSNNRVAVDLCGGIQSIQVDGAQMLSQPIAFAVLHDDSDTWSHGLERYDGDVLSQSTWGKTALVEDGPLRTTVRLQGQLGETPFSLYISLRPDSSVVRLKLILNYQTPESVLKMLVLAEFQKRLDRVAGGWFERPLDGKELPFHHALRVDSTAGGIGLVLPDTFAVDASEDVIRPTLIRNSYYAFHNTEGNTVTSQGLADRPQTDTGHAVFRMALAFADQAHPKAMESLLDEYHQPPFIWDDYAYGQRLHHLEAHR